MQTFNRTEQKFWVAPDRVDELARQIEQHVPPFVYDQRLAAGHTASVYFDTPRLDLYRQRVLSPSDNMLVRVRWYGSSPSERLFTELKMLREQRLTKNRVQLTVFDLNDFLRRRDLARLAEREARGGAGAPPRVHQVGPVTVLAPRLQVRYIRRSFQVAGDDRVRLTLDQDVVFSAMNGERARYCPFAILEVKLHAEQPAWVDELIASPHVAECRGFSKYVQGCASVYDLREFGLPEPWWMRSSALEPSDSRGERMTTELFETLPSYEFNGDALAGGRANRRISREEVATMLVTDACELDLPLRSGRC